MDLQMIHEHEGEFNATQDMQDINMEEGNQVHRIENDINLI